MLTKVTDTFFIDLEQILGILIVEGQGILKFKNQSETLKINKDKAYKLCLILDDQLKASEMGMTMKEYSEHKRQRDADE